MQTISNGYSSGPASDQGLGAGLASIASLFQDTGQRQMREAALADAARKVAAQRGVATLLGSGNMADLQASIANGTPLAEGSTAMRIADGIKNGIYGRMGDVFANATDHNTGSAPADLRAAGVAAAAAEAARRGAPQNYVQADGTLIHGTAGAPPVGAQPLVSTDELKSGLLSHVFLPTPGAPGAPATPAATTTADNAPDDAPDTSAPVSSAFSAPSAAIPSAAPAAGPTAAPTTLGALFGAPGAAGAALSAPTPAAAAPLAKVAAPAVPALSPDQRTLVGLDKAANDPKFGVIGEDQFGNKKYGYPPAYDANAAALPAAADTSGPTAGVLDMHGPQFMAQLDPATAGQVQAIIDGRAPYPTGMLLKTPYGQKLASYVTQADPSFESGNATARVQTRKDFEAGGPNSVAGTITAGNTAIQHLGQLSDTIEELGKSDTGIPLLNMGKNAIGTATGGAIPVVQFNNIMGKLAEELTKFYRGTGGDQADVARDLANFNPSMSLPQLRAATQTVAGLVASKVNALQDRWHTAMGPNVPDFPIVQPHSAQALSVVQQRGGAPAASADVAPAAPGGAPPVATVKTPADVAALPSGTRFLIPDGSGRIGVAP